MNPGRSEIVEIGLIGCPYRLAWSTPASSTFSPDDLLLQAGALADNVYLFFQQTFGGISRILLYMIPRFYSHSLLLENIIFHSMLHIII